MPPLSMPAAILASSIASGLLGAGSNVASSFLAYNQQKKLMDKQAKINYNYSIKSAKNLPSANRAGLENAGYNPLLAVQNATSGANSSWASQSSANAPDISGGLANAFEVQKLSNETKLADSQSNLFNEQSKTEDSKRTNLEFENALLDVKKRLADKDLDTYDRRFYSQLNEQMERAKYYRSQANIVGYNAETGRIAANAQKTQAETSAKWTPVGIGSGIAAGIGGFALGKIPALKYLKKAKVGF